METFSALLALCAGNSPVTSEFPAQRLVTRCFDVFFDLRPNKCLSKQSWGWWSETRSLWRHCNVMEASQQIVKLWVTNPYLHVKIPEQKRSPLNIMDKPLLNSVYLSVVTSSDENGDKLESLQIQWCRLMWRNKCMSMETHLSIYHRITKVFK